MIPTNSQGFSTNSQWFSPILNDSQISLELILIDSQISLKTDSHWFLLILNDSQWFLPILTDSCQFLMILK